MAIPYFVDFGEHWRLCSCPVKGFWCWNLQKGSGDTRRLLKAALAEQPHCSYAEYMFILPGWGEGEEVKKEVDLGGGVESWRCQGSLTGGANLTDQTPECQESDGLKVGVTRSEI